MGLTDKGIMGDYGRATGRGDLMLPQVPCDCSLS